MQFPSGNKEMLYSPFSRNIDSYRLAVFFQISIYEMMSEGGIAKLEASTRAL